MATKYKYTSKSKNLSKAKVEISINVDKSSIETAKDKAYRKLAATVRIKGFRPGKAPRNQVEAELGTKLFEEGINILLPEITKEILAKEKLQPIAPLEYSLTKYAQGEDLEFKAVIYVLPELDVKKLKKIKVKKGESKVTEEEINKVIESMLKENGGQPVVKKDKKESKKDEGLSIVGNDKRKKTTKTPKTGIKAQKKPTDKWAASLNIGAKTVKELREKIEQELTRRKEYMAEQKFRYDILEETIKLTDAEVPDITIRQELNHRMTNFLENLKRLNMSLEKYLETQKLKEDDLKKQWEKEIEKSIMVELILEQIARANKIKITDKEVQEEIDKIEDKKLKKKYDSEQGRFNVMVTMRKSKALKYLFETVNKKPSKK